MDHTSSATSQTGTAEFPAIQRSKRNAEMLAINAYRTPCGSFTLGPGYRQHQHRASPAFQYSRNPFLIRVTRHRLSIKSQDTDQRRLHIKVIRPSPSSSTASGTRTASDRRPPRPYRRVVMNTRSHPAPETNRLPSGQSDRQLRIRGPLSLLLGISTARTAGNSFPTTSDSTTCTVLVQICSTARSNIPSAPPLRLSFHFTHASHQLLRMSYALPFQLGSRTRLILPVDRFVTRTTRPRPQPLRYAGGSQLHGRVRQRFRNGTQSSRIPRLDSPSHQHASPTSGC